MDPSNFGNTSLTMAQADMIVADASGLVQTNPFTGALFIDLQPILIAPEPGSLVIFGSRISLVLMWRRRSSRQRPFGGNA